MQRELQTLNSALNNFKAAGGTIPEGSSASDAIALIKSGVGVGSSNYSSLLSDPPLTQSIGGEVYNLSYDDVVGFSFVPADGNGSEYSENGSEVSGSAGGPSFDIGNRDAALAALGDLAALNQDDPAYTELLDALNGAYTMGTLTDSDMLGAGLGEYNGIWSDGAQVQELLAQDAQDIIDAGGTWSSLSPELQSAWANQNPTNAVQLAGAQALNVISPSLLNNSLVSGYGNINGTWTSTAKYIDPTNTPVTPIVNLGSSSAYWSPYSTYYGWTNPVVATLQKFGGVTNLPSWSSGGTYTIYAAPNPTQPAVAVGSIIGYYGAYGMQMWGITRLGNVVGALNADGSLDQWGQSSRNIYDHGVVLSPVSSSFNNNGDPLYIKTPTGSAVFFIQN